MGHRGNNGTNNHLLQESLRQSNYQVEEVGEADHWEAIDVLVLFFLKTESG